MDWRNLQALAILYREGSLAGAARALGVNHATISRRIASLEDEAGEPLVRRLARSTPLTEKGREIAAIAVQMADQAQGIERSVQARHGMVSGTVRLTAPPAFVSETLIPSMRDLRRLHPHLRLILSADAQLASLDSGAADLAVRLVEPAGQQNVVRRLGAISYALYATPDYARLPPDRWEFMGFDASLAHTPQQLWLDSFAAGRPFALLASDYYTQRAAAEAGLGIALLPERITAPSARLVRVTDQRPPARTAWLVIHSDLRHSSAVRTVADYVIRLFASDPAQTG